MQHRQRRVHGQIWLVLAVLLPLGFIAGLAFRQERPLEPTVFSGSQAR
jgi:hypothetical protein